MKGKDMMRNGGFIINEGGKIETAILVSSTKESQKIKHLPAVLKILVKHTGLLI